MRLKVFLLIAVILVTSCASAVGSTSEPGAFPPDTAITNPPQGDITTQESMENPFSPQPADSKLTRVNVFIHGSELVIRESYPPQISLNLSGELPTPCHQLRVKVNAPDADNKINIDVYSVVDPDMICTQVLKPFEESIDLGTFLSGHYTVWVNGEGSSEFDS